MKTRFLPLLAVVLIAALLPLTLAPARPALAQEEAGAASLAATFELHFQWSASWFTATVYLQDDHTFTDSQGHSGAWSYDAPTHRASLVYPECPTVYQGVALSPQLLVGRMEAECIGNIGRWYAERVVAGP